MKVALAVSVVVLGVSATAVSVAVASGAATSHSDSSATAALTAPCPAATAQTVAQTAPVAPQETPAQEAPTLPHLMHAPDSQAAKLNELLAALGGNNTSCGYSATANGDLLGVNIRSTFPTQDALDAANVLITAFEQAHSLVIDKTLELET